MTNNLGIGVMINLLGGNSKTVAAIQGSIEKTIQKVWLDKQTDELKFQFTDGTNLKLLDAGQSCCEHRYMTTDDDLPYYSGATLLGFELKDAPDQEDEYGNVHDVQFLDVNTSKGVFQMANHNEHNGYYGGFSIVAETF